MTPTTVSAAASFGLREVEVVPGVWGTKVAAGVTVATGSTIAALTSLMGTPQYPQNFSPSLICFPHDAQKGMDNTRLNINKILLFEFHVHGTIG